MRRLSTSIVIVGLATCAQLTLACAFGEFRWSDPLKRQFSLEDAQRQYTEYVRWSAFDKASRYVEPEMRDEYLANAPSTRELRFTDYEMKPVEIDDETGEATVEVTYFAYYPNSPIETQLKEVQHWRRLDKGNSWRVKPAFPQLADSANGAEQP